VSLRIPLFVFAVWLACHAGAQEPPEARPARSQSGQFFVSRARRGAWTPAASALATNAQFLELEPTLLVVSCERIRQAMTRELGLATPWRGKIHIRLRTATGAEDPITVTLEQFRDGWNYRVDLPDVVERARLVRVLVEVLLLEIANQHATGRSAELPPWLAVGFAERLISASEWSLLFPPPRVGAGAFALGPTVVTNRADPLATARVRLREQSPLTLQELNWPVERDFAGETSKAYRASAQLLVSELLRLADGAACFRALLNELPQYFNWQTAFLKAFHPHFARLLDLEKWWSLQSVSFAGRDPAYTWSMVESWRKLDEALHLPAQVRAAANQLPSGAAFIPLQMIVSEWDSVRQTAALRGRLQQFDLLRQRLTPELLPLLLDYRRVLAGYLEQRDKLGVSLARGRAARPALKQLMAGTVRQLDKLDAKTRAFRVEAPQPSSPVNPPPGEPAP
jgi:hypothetical protein